MTRIRGDTGQAMLLVLGIMLVCFAVAGVAVDITRAALLRRTLQSAADSAATAGASQLDATSYYATGGTDARLDRSRAGREAAEVFSRRRDIVRLRADTSGDGVRINVGARMKTSFLRIVGITHLTVTAEAGARPVLGEG